MKHLLLVSAVLLAVSVSIASDSDIKEAPISEKERQDYSQEYLSRVALEREQNYKERLAIIKEHAEYMKEIGRGHHNR